jgi:hypothetical protein
LEMKHYNSASLDYAYAWCEQLADWDPTMGRGTPMEELYAEYADKARHLDRVRVKFKLKGSRIRPVDIDTWYDIFCEVFELWGEWDFEAAVKALRMKSLH